MPQGHATSGEGQVRCGAVGVGGNAADISTSPRANPTVRTTPTGVRAQVDASCQG